MTDFDDINDEKVYGALRSLYRYNEMNDDSVPEILLESESDLLKKRFEQLNAHEIFAVVAMWQEYLKEQIAVEHIDNQMFERHLQTLN